MPLPFFVISPPMNLTEIIKSVILSNLHSEENRRIGIEVECFFYNNTGVRIPTNPCNEFSAVDLLEEMKRRSKHNNVSSGYSLEPGGQLEWASPPVKTLHELNHHFQTHLRWVKAVCDEHGLSQSDLAIEPLCSPEEIELIDMKKYHVMHNRFLSTGKHGAWMMKNTTSVQVNLDISSEADAEEMAYISDCLQPFCAVLFANSPFMNSQPVGLKNTRADVWSDTDKSRCGNLLDHEISKPEGLLNKFSVYLQNVPTIFVKDGSGKTINYEGTLGKWLQEKKKSGILTHQDVLLALHQVFTHVRFKTVIEIRGADRPPVGFEMAPAAFWLGLLTAKKTRTQVMALLKKWTVEDRKKLHKLASRLDLNINVIGNISFKQGLDQVCDLAMSGLDERSETLHIKNERSLLEDYVNEINTHGLPSLRRQKDFAESRVSLREFLFRTRRD